MLKNQAAIKPFCLGSAIGVLLAAALRSPGTILLLSLGLIVAYELFHE
jgi:hypothetical protein